MSVHVGLRGMVVEVGRPGTLIPGRGVVARAPDYFNPFLEALEGGAL